MTKTIDEIDTIYTRYPVCPYCGEKNIYWCEDYPFRNDGDTDEVNCPFCMRRHYVTIHLSEHFTTRELENDKNSNR